MTERRDPEKVVREIEREPRRKTQCRLGRSHTPHPQCGEEGGAVGRLGGKWWTPVFPSTNDMVPRAMIAPDGIFGRDRG